ncbi:hypothetical protein ACHAXR_001540 [Thalassiosira sp. AJA248-18]
MNRMNYAVSYGRGGPDEHHQHHGSFTAPPLPPVAEKLDAAATDDDHAMMIMNMKYQHNTTNHHHATNTSSSSSSRPPFSSTDNDAPLVTPTVQTRMTLSKAFLRKNLPTPPLTADIERNHRLNNSQQQQQQQGSSSSSSSASAAPRNPLDLLSLVSTRVAEKENSDRISMQTNDSSDGGEDLPSNNNTNNNNHKNNNSPPYIGERNPSGQRHGRGIMHYPNGCHYNGCFTNDKRHGFGECWYPNGCVYTGFWSNGQRSGIGKMIYADRGDVYEGEWLADRRHGRGIYFRSDGRADVTRYECHDVVGEGVQWSPNREFCVRLVGGVNRGMCSVGRALEICGRIGVPGVPKKMFPEGVMEEGSPGSS